MRTHAMVTALLATALASTPSRADTTFGLIPRLGFGATNNATGVSSADLRRWDEFWTAAANAHLEHDRGRSNHVLGYRILYTRFLTQSSANTLTNELTWVSLFHLTAALDLGLDAAAALSSTSQLAGSTNLGMVMPQPLMSGTAQYFRGDVGQKLTYQIQPTWTVRELARFTHLEYVGSSPGPTTNAVDANAGSDWQLGLNILSADADLTVASTTSPVPGAAVGTFTFVGGEGSWKRELNPSWTTSLRAGASVLVREGASSTFVPLVAAAIDYRRLPWFASLTAGQTAAANVYVGGITINDSVLAHLTLPLDQRELAVITGYGGYTHARTQSAAGTVATAFDQWAGGASIIAHHPRWPLFTALEYTIVDQIGSTSAAATAPTLVRQTLMASIGGTFVWGPGTPPLFRGGVF